jgi:hypothetical protein
MSLLEIMPDLRALPRAEKLQAIQYLAGELARDEGINPSDAGQAFPVWSPFDAHDAAVVLLEALDAERQRS